jgi:hypothetical protein
VKVTLNLVVGGGSTPASWKYAYCLRVERNPEFTIPVLS